MKYIDADKLIAEIRELRSESCIGESDEYYEYAKSEIIDIITSLQQEQPEVDLKKEIDKYFALWRQGTSDEGCVNADSQFVSIYDCYRIARHFFELGQIDAANKFDDIEYNRLREEAQENNERKEEE